MDIFTDVFYQNSKNPKRQFFLFFISVSLWSCLLWTILCCYFPSWYSKASRPYFSSNTVERMRNELWWSCWHGCLSLLSIGVIPPAADSGEKKSSVSGFTDALLMKWYYKKNLIKAMKFTNTAVTTWIYHVGTFTCAYWHRIKV